MNWVAKIQTAIDYIEDNITYELDMNIPARIMLCSRHDFQRIFAYLVGIPLSEYLKRRRLTLAGIEIRDGKDKIMDISIKYGYESHASFTRSFKEFHGITPKESRENTNHMLNSYPEFSIYMSLEEQNV